MCAEKKSKGSGLTSFRRELARACEREDFELRLAEKSLCIDNAAMIGILAKRKTSG
jgi:tRNA A37 threonylcarbamoyltransferase TsaD